MTAPRRRRGNIYKSQTNPTNRPTTRSPQSPQSLQNRRLVAGAPYSIRYEEGFEPYVLVARKFVPWTDERFVGYRKNKVVHLLHLASLGLQFVVHPRAFVVHSPHPRARTWKVTHTTGLWEQLAELYHRVREGLEADTYVPASMYSCGDHVLGPIVPQVHHISEWTDDAR